MLCSVSLEPETCPISNDINVEPFGDNLYVTIPHIPEEDRNGKIIQYVIFFKSRSMVEFKNVTINATDEGGHTLKNMSYAKNYGFKIAAVNSAGMCKGWQSLKLYYETHRTNGTYTLTLLALATLS